MSKIKEKTIEEIADDFITEAIESDAGDIHMEYVEETLVEDGYSLDEIRSVIRYIGSRAKRCGLELVYNPRSYNLRY